MLEVTQEDAASKTIEVLIDGQVSLEAMTKLNKTIAMRAQEWGAVNVLERFVTIDGIEPRAIWEDLRLYAQNRKKFHKVAVVTNKNWIKTLSAVMGAFFRPEIRSFSNEELQHARRWLAA